MIRHPVLLTLFALLLSVCSVAAQDENSGSDTAQENLKQRVERVKEERGPKNTLIELSAISSTRVNDVTFDDIAFEMEKGAEFRRSMLTERIKKLNKKKIRLSGYIRPSFKQSGLTRFVFVRDNKECCFGPGAALFDCVLVKLAKDEETEYTVRPIKIEGDFYLKEFKGPDGNIWAIYRMKNAVVK